MQDSVLFEVSNISDGVGAIRRQRITGPRHISITTALNGVKVYADEDQILGGKLDITDVIERVARSIDFMKMDEFTLFCIVFYDLQERQKEHPDVFRLIFGEFDLSKLTPVRLEDNNTVIQNANGSIRIDGGAHERLCDILRVILCIEKNVRNPANEEARQFMLKMERRKQRRAARERDDGALRLSPLESLIISAVNTAEFPYTYETVLDLTIYQFNSSIRQINNKIRFDNLMIGCYAGTVKAKELSNQELSWMALPQP